MPRESHYKSEVFDSDDYAEQMLEAQRQAEEQQKKRTMLGYSDVLDALYNIADRLGALYSVTIAVNSENGKAPDVAPMPRPETAVDRIRDKKFMQRHRGRVAKLLSRGEADG